MKKINLLIVAIGILLMSGCATNYRAQINALGHYDYNVTSVDQIFIVGRDINSFDTKNGASLSAVPGIAFGILRKDLPLKARVNLQISNPTNTVADINEFKYIIELYGKPLFEGSIDKNIKLAKGESMIVPLTFSANIFGVANEQGFDKILNDIFTRNSTAFFALKIKPSIKIGNKNIFYPGYITVDKDLGKGIIR